MEKKTTKKKIAPKKTAASRIAKKVAVAKVAKSDLTAPLYTMAGKEAGTVALPAALFGVSWNNDLVRQVALSMMSNARAGTGQAHTKDRSEVRGGGKKPWKQKGTGRARHGSNRSPIWVGGGITHGPRADKDYSKRIPRGMRSKALVVVLSKKFRDGEVFFVDSLSFTAPKTAEAKKALTAFAGIEGFAKIATKNKNALFVALADKNDNAKKSFANFGNVEVDELRNLNVVDILSTSFLLIENPEASLTALAAKMK